MRDKETLREVVAKMAQIEVLRKTYTTLDTKDIEVAAIFAAKVIKLQDEVIEVLCKEAVDDLILENLQKDLEN